MTVTQRSTRGSNIINLIGNTGRVHTDVPTVNTWTPLITQWQQWLRAGATPQSTLSLRRYQLTRLHADHRHCGPFDLTSADLAEWMSAHDWAPETLRSYRSALRSFYGWAHASGFISTDPARLLRKVPAPPAKPRPASEVCVNDALGRADERAWLMLMLGSRQGLRRGEIARVHTHDLIELADGRAELLIHGKGSKNRVVPLLDEVADAIRQLPTGWAFPNGKGTHLTPGHIGVVLRPYLSGGVTPHRLRHRFASRAYQSTNDIRAVQELLGHASVATTQIYVAISNDALRRAVSGAAA